MTTSHSRALACEHIVCEAADEGDDANEDYAEDNDVPFHHFEDAGKGGTALGYGGLNEVETAANNG